MLEFSDPELAWPDELDLEEAMDGILRILHIYDLNLEEVISKDHFLIIFELKTVSSF